MCRRCLVVCVTLPGQPGATTHTLLLRCCMRAAQVDPQFFAFRWITLLLTQEFPFPDAVRIWDTLLSDPGGRVDCLLRVCVALLMNVRQQLLEGEVPLLHSAPCTENLACMPTHPGSHLAEVAAACGCMCSDAGQTGMQIAERRTPRNKWSGALYNLVTLAHSELQPRALSAAQHTR